MQLIAVVLARCPTMSKVKKIEAAIKRFAAVAWCSSGYPLAAADGGSTDIGWVKFGLRKSELGWRTLEFLAWVCTDMIRAGERLEFFPTAPPPYLNTPGDCLSFVIECHPLDGDQDERFQKVARFISFCRAKYWPRCHRGPENPRSVRNNAVESKRRGKP
jgi:hypothetical protein